ncbi:MAG: 23S rRNA (uracil(1939)-C(5))-methyltransferase RlmD [Proteobacteria bacterium]|nr:23S rRNA (uracil(1939)-C(5))-methyltransferase RlmD [Pseudomonadota bacterium]
MKRPGLRKPRTQGTLPRNIYRRQPLVRRPGVVQPEHLTTEPVCGIKALCGACKYVNQDYKDGLNGKFQAGLKVLEESGLQHLARILQPVPSPRQLGYRSLFKLAVRPATTSLKQASSAYDRMASTPSDELLPVLPERFAVGLFAAGSHDVVDMDRCPLHTPPLEALLRDLRVELNMSTLTPYDEATKTGQLRYITARSAHLTGELMVTFVVTEALKVELRQLVANLQRRGHRINSAHMNLNTDSGNAIFGAESVRLSGAERLRERLCDLDFEIGPTAFFQINPWQAINLYRRIESIAGRPSTPGQVAWDLYSGTGQISLMLARQGYRVLGIEENPGAVADAQLNAKRNHLEPSAAFIAARVEDAAQLVPTWATSPSLIIANPSRRGMADSTRRHIAVLLANNPGARFVYVSCEIASMARDIKILSELSGFQLRQVEPFDMFPQTDNMEWLAVLSRP